MKEIITLEKFVITGGKPLQGEVTISGAKNAAVGILPATILAGGVCVIENLPNISDVSVSLNILSALGAQVRMLRKNTYEIDTTHLMGTNVPDDLSRQMRASYYFLGALLSRFGKAQVAMPGGCNLGPRPIDQHLKAFSALGAQDSVDYGMITVRAKEKLRGARIFFDKVSVGAHHERHALRRHGRGPDRAGELRQGTPCGGPGQLPEYVRRRCAGRRHRRHQGAGSHSDAWVHLQHHPRPDRGRQLYGGRRGHRRGRADQERHPQTPGAHHRQAAPLRRRGGGV